MKKNSIEEKRMNLYKLMNEEGGFFNKKEFEQLARKCLIQPMAIKDSMNFLLSENLISCEKVGISTVYWVPKVNEFVVLTKKRDQLIDEKEKLIEKKKNLEIESNNLKEELKGINIDKICEMHDNLKIKIEELEKTLGDNSVDVNVLKNQINVAKNAIIRWADNLSIIQQWLENKHLLHNY